MLLFNFVGVLIRFKNWQWNGGFWKVGFRFWKDKFFRLPEHTNIISIHIEMKNTPCYTNRL